MRIKDHTDMVRHLTDPFNIPEARRMIAENPALTQEQFKEGGRIGFQRGSGNPIKITDEVLDELDKLIKGSDKTLKEIGRDLGYAADLRSDSYVIKAYEDRFGKIPQERFKPYKLTKDSPQVIKVMEEYKKLGSKQAVEESTGISRKSQRGYFKQFKPEEIKKANIPGPITGAKELKKRRLETIKDLKKYWKSQKGGELILKHMDKKLADIAAENKTILKMSDDAIWNNKKFKDAMQLNVKKLKTGEGLKFDRYEGLSKKDFVKKVKDLAAKGEFVQPEHIIPIKARNPDSLLAKNIFSAYGEVGGQMEVLKDFSKANTIGKRPKEVFSFLKGQNIPIEKPGFWKVTKKGASKVGKALFGPVEIGTLPLWLAGEALYSQYANKRDLKKALDKMDIPQYKKNLLLEGYRQEAVDLGDVGLEDWAIDQPNISLALEKIGYGDRDELMKDAAGAIADVREMEAQEEAARYEKLYPRAQRERFDRDEPMFAEGGIASLKK